MLDKLKDIVPEVDENKANLIYLKSKKAKRRFGLNINFNLVLKYAVFFIVLIPVIVIVSLHLGDKISLDLNAPEPPQMEPNGSEGFWEPEEPEDDNLTKDIVVTSNFIDDVLYLDIITNYEICYLKSHEDYEISSVVASDEEISINDSSYCVAAVSTIQITFNANIENKIIIYISTDNINFEPITINIE